MADSRDLDSFRHGKVDFINYSKLQMYYVDIG